MLLSVFDLIWALVRGCWQIVSAVLELVGRLFGASVEFLCRVVDKAWDLLTRPFSWGLGQLLDISVWSSMDIGGMFGWVMARLLVLVMLVGLVALAVNLYRRCKKAI